MSKRTKPGGPRDGIEWGLGPKPLEKTPCGDVGCPGCMADAHMIRPHWERRYSSAYHTHGLNRRTRRALLHQGLVKEVS